MTDERAQVEKRVIERRLEQTKADDGCAVNAQQIVIVGLVTRMLGLPELSGGEGMDDACFITGIAKGALHEAMVVARAFDGDEEIGQCEPGSRGAERLDGLTERRRRVLDSGRWEQHMTIEVTEHPARALFGTVHGNDTEAFWSHSAHAGVDDAVGIGELSLETSF